jgi:hypothetical protein
MHIKQQILIGSTDYLFNNLNPFSWMNEAKDDTIDRKDLHNIKAKVDQKTFKLSLNDQESA